MKIVLAGGTGFIGKALRKELLGAGHEVIVLTRGQSFAAGHEKFVTWDTETSGGWARYVDGADVIVNLVGENIAAGRWTVRRKEALLLSRVHATQAIVTAIHSARVKPAVLINISAVGYYGDPGDQLLDESSPKGLGFLAEVCDQWETEARKAEAYGARVILARLGPVLGGQGGMLSKMLPPFRFFMGAPLGSGRQWIPWVHREDVTGAILWMLERPELSGPVNVTSPEPATMKAFSAALARTLRRPCWFPVPAFLMKLLLGEMASILLSSQKATPQKLLASGYQFRFPVLSEALASILQG